MFFGEGKSGTGLQVLLESRGLVMIFEAGSGFQFPRAVLGCVRRPARIVLFPPRVQVVCEPDIALFGVAQAAEYIDVPHDHFQKRGLTKSGDVIWGGDGIIGF